MEFALISAGFAVGILTGMTSMGGAALMAPLLILVVGVRPVTAVGTDLVYGAFTKMVGAWVHLRQGTVDLAMVKRLAAGSAPGGIVGACTVVLLPHTLIPVDYYLRRFIGVVLIVVAAAVLLRISRVLKAIQPSQGMLDFLRGPGAIVFGAAAGFCVGVTSVGSGSLLAPFLMLLYPAKTNKIVGTDVFHAAVLVFVTAFVHASFGAVDWHLAANLLIGSVPGVIFGSRLATHIPPRPLRATLALVLLCTGWKMF